LDCASPLALFFTRFQSRRDFSALVRVVSKSKLGYSLAVDQVGTRVLLALLAAWCVTGWVAHSAGVAEKTGKENMQLTSTAFTHGAAIPVKHTCDAADLSPPLKWSGVPTGAKSLVLIVDDPDAPVGTWVHWVLYDLPPTVSEMPEGVTKAETTPDGGKQGRNDFKRLGYGGPCPPPGAPHRYFFKLYALDKPLELKAGATKKEVERAMDKHVLAQAELMGTYQRKQ
jgi:Raf kinase inhibitor-like YbhB/YbcL family protein